MDALLNWLWQGCVVTLAATVVLRPRAMSAATRYYLWWTTLLLVLLLPAAPMLSLAGSADLVTDETARALPSVVSVPLPAIPRWPVTVGIALWAAWVAASLWRAAAELVSLRGVKRSCQPFPVAREARLSNWMSIRTAGRPARLIISPKIRFAAVLGLWSPAIAVAPSLLQELRDEELDQILLHEWAHVQRHDDVACLLQLLIYALAGVHPAIWWIDRRLKVEREAACDDWAVRVTGSAKSYAACLAKLATLPAHTRDAVLVPAALSASAVTARIIRLLDRHRNRSTRRSLTALAVTVPVLLAIVLNVASVQLVVRAIPAIPSSNGIWPAGTIASSSEVAPPDSANTFDRSVRRASSERRKPQAGPTRRPVAPATNRATLVASNAGGSSEQTRRPEGSPQPEIASPSDLVHAPAALPLALNDLPGPTVPIAPREDAASSTQNQKEKSATPWGTAADAGVAVGRGSRKAGTATAGFFTKLSKSIAGVF